MAVRTAASGDIIKLTSGLPAANSFTACGVSRWVTNLGAGTWQVFFAGQSAALSSAFSGLVYWTIESGSGLSGMRMGWSDGVANNHVQFTAKPSVGQWFFWYMKCSGYGTGLLEAGWMPFGKTAFTEVNNVDTANNISPTFSQLNLGYSQAGTSEQFEGAYCSCRFWNVALTTAQILVEARNARAVVTSGLLIDIPLTDNTLTAALLDKSGNGSNATSGGSPVLDASVLYYPGKSRQQRNTLLRR